MTTPIPQMEPLFTDADVRAVSSYMGSGGWVTEHRVTREFEQAIADYTGMRYCTVTPSGTLALFLALAACGVGAGDEVIVPDLTMAASASAVILAGARIRFGDIEASSLCLDIEAAKAQVTAETKAIILVSLNGRAPKELAAFAQWCTERGIRLIEDAAQSLGSFVGGTHLGGFGDCGCFSFSSQKVVTTGQGGAVVTNDESLYRQMLLLRDFGRRSGGNDDYVEVGWNLKFTDLQATLGVSQMAQLPGRVSRKRALFDLYRQSLADLEQVVLPATDTRCTTPWFVDALVSPHVKGPLMEYLAAAEIGTRPFYPALHSTPAFASGATESFPESSNASACGLWLPSSLRMSDGDVSRVCDVVRAFFQRRG